MTLLEIFLIIQISGHKILESVNNYSSLSERQMENISHILSTTAPNAIVQAQRKTSQSDQLSQSMCSSNTSTEVDVKENSLQEMFHANVIAEGTFHINVAAWRKVLPKLNAKDAGNLKVNKL